jgi:hypothetical protein
MSFICYLTTLLLALHHLYKHYTRADTASVDPACRAIRFFPKMLM